MVRVFHSIQVTKAATALLKHASKKSAAEAGDKNELFAEEQFVWLLVGLKKVPDLKKKAIKMYGTAVLRVSPQGLVANRHVYCAAPFLLQYTRATLRSASSPKTLSASTRTLWRRRTSRL